MNLTTFVKLFRASFSLFMKKGFIQNIDTYVSVNEIFQNLDVASRGIVIGLKRRIDFNTNLPSGRVEITFNVTWVPRNIEAYDTLFQITPIIPLTMRYFHC